MTSVTLNIGLENNPWSFTQVVNYFKTYSDGEALVRLATGTYNGNTERTAVVLFETDRGVIYIREWIERLCKLMTQESIAMKFGKVGMLIYAEDFRGERHSFDQKYFIEYHDMVDRIIAFEQGELSDADCVYLFSDLIRTGKAWSLQGMYGRIASSLIERGIVMVNGDIDEMAAIECGIEM